MAEILYKTPHEITLRVPEHAPYSPARRRSISRAININLGPPKWWGMPTHGHTTSQSRLLYRDMEKLWQFHIEHRWFIWLDKIKTTSHFHYHTLNQMFHRIHLIYLPYANRKKNSNKARKEEITTSQCPT